MDETYTEIVVTKRVIEFKGNVERVISEEEISCTREEIDDTAEAVDVAELSISMVWALKTAGRHSRFITTGRNGYHPNTGRGLARRGLVTLHHSDPHSQYWELTEAGKNIEL